MNRRRRYADITEESFTLTKRDGRRHARYWDDAAESWRYVYRYRWRWEQLHGPVPEGMDLHHKNGDPTDDRIENLELRERIEHRRLHLTPERAREMRRKNLTRPVRTENS